MRLKKHWYMAVVCGVLAGLLHLAYLRAVNVTVPVVVAAKDLRPFGRIEADSIRVAHVHPQAVHPKAVTALGGLVGRHISSWCLEGQQILSPFLDAFPVESGWRAMMIPATWANAAGGTIRPADVVDVVYVTDPGETGFSIARVVEQGLLVLDVRSDSGSSLFEDRKSSMLGVVVAVTLEQAERLAFCLEHGRIHLLLSSAANEPSWTKGVSLANVIQFQEPPGSSVGAGETW